MREQVRQMNGDGNLPAGMAESRGRAHEDVAVAIGLNATRKSRERRISQDLDPAREIPLVLRIQVRQLDGDRHERRYAKKRKNEDRQRLQISGKAVRLRGNVSAFRGICCGSGELPPSIVLVLVIVLVFRLFFTGHDQRSITITSTIEE
jgi:hypothetical protein